MKTVRTRRTISKEIYNMMRRVLLHKRKIIYCVILVLCLALSILLSQCIDISLVNAVSFTTKSRVVANHLPLNSNHELLLDSIPKTYTSGYIVYQCNHSEFYGCGGWSDRLSGILSTFVISLLTKQHFLIQHDDPCLLQDFLAPKEYDWRYNSSILFKRKSKTYYLLNKKSRKAKKYLYGEKDLNSYFKSDQVNFIRMNWDFTEVFRTRPHIGRDVPWITQLHYADIYKELFNYLFKPSETLSRALKSQKRHRAKTACAHIRIGKSPTMPKDSARHQQSLEILWRFFDNIDKDVYDIFIATDDDRVLMEARNRYPKHIIDTNGTIGHIDQPIKKQKHNQQEIFLKMFSDFYMLINCDILILTESGFGMTAAYIRNIDSGLYCWRGPELKPCSRYTVHHMFPWPMLAPSKLFPHDSHVKKKAKSL